MNRILSGVTVAILAFPVASLSAQNPGRISASQLSTWASEIAEHLGLRGGCEELRDEALRGIDRAIENWSGGYWEWVAEIDGGANARTFYQYDTNTGEIVRVHVTMLSIKNRGDQSDASYSQVLQTVAHEALHWVLKVELDSNGEVVENHYGYLWDQLDSCFGGF